MADRLSAKDLDAVRRFCERNAPWLRDGVSDHDESIRDPLVHRQQKLRYIGWSEIGLYVKPEGLQRASHRISDLVSTAHGRLLRWRSR